jgi:hypothetical protein
LVASGTKRNQINIQNYSGMKVFINYDDTVPGQIGMVINSGSERQYTIQGDIVLWAKCEIGSADITIEELA